jgi:hypothetical protein
MTIQQSDDAEFGTLRRSPIGWVGATPFGGRPVALVLATECPATDSVLRALARRVLLRLEPLDQLARDIAKRTQPDLRLDRLDAIAVLYPLPNWIEQLLADGVSTAAALTPARPIASLSYALIGERSVLDIAIDGEIAFEADCH